MQRDIELEATLVAKYAVVAPVLDERSRRRWAAAESLAIGYGGDAVVSSATGLARETIRKGRREIARDEAPTDRIRRPGGGRPRIQQDQPGIQAALEALVDPLRTVSKAFVHLRRAAGVSREPEARYQPRLHDLRHAFAVHRLTAWYREGADVQRLLPLLSTYLGHVSVAATQVYLSMTPELLEEAARRFERYTESANGGDHG